MKITVQNDGEQPINLKMHPLRRGSVVEPGEVGSIEFTSPPAGGVVWVMELGEDDELGILDQSEGA